MNKRLLPPRLGVNIDHVATIRNARGGDFPDPVRAAKLAEQAGADGITAHLREDRRHISDEDIERLIDQLTVPLNFEMAATDEMLEIALKHRPHERHGVESCCLTTRGQRAHKFIRFSSRFFCVYLFVFGNERDL